MSWLRLCLAMVLMVGIGTTTAWADDGGAVEEPVETIHIVGSSVSSDAPCCNTPLSYEEACCLFKTLKPGKYSFTIIHPETCCPVDVCFCLPCGCFDVECSSLLGKKIRFKYPGLCNDVVIRFKKCGDVSVKG